MKADQPIEGLREVFLRHGCDKAAHFYHEFYQTLPPPASMLEVGVYKGASLRAWCEWWPQCDVVGIDTFDRHPCPDDFKPMGGICVLQLDSTRKADLRCYWSEEEGKPFPSLIIDDGSHKPRDQAATLRNLWPLLAPGGVYVIEDVWPLDLMCENSQRHHWLKKHREHFTMEAFLELANAIAATGGKMTRHDFRAKSGKPDSVLVAIRK